MTAIRTPTAERIVSLDQFRGYTVLGMFLVNFVGSFSAAHWLLKHHNTFCSYADTIMPQFFFAVGFAFRLTMLRRAAEFGVRAAQLRAVRRIAGLLLVALVIYTADRPAERWAELVRLGFWESVRSPLKSDFFQTLTHIGVTSLWVLPVIRASAGIRVGYLLASAGLHVAVSHGFYFAWVNNGSPNGIDGGPLGFLTWTIPVLVGSLCADPFLGPARRLPVWRTAGWAVALMALGYAMSCGTRCYDLVPAQRGTSTVPRIASRPVIPPREAVERAGAEWAAGDRTRLCCEPPFCPPPPSPGEARDGEPSRQWNYWMMSQRGGTLSYQTFSAGFSVAVFLLAHLLCDRRGWTLGILRTLGTNALAGYLLHMLVADAVQRFTPSDAPAWYMWSVCGLYLLITYLLLRGLERAGIFLRL